jgi:hypothetical protein
VRGTLGMRQTQATGRWAPGILSGFTQTIGIVTTPLVLAHVGSPSCQVVPSLSPLSCSISPMVSWSLFRTEQDSFLKRSGTNEEPFLSRKFRLKFRRRFLFQGIRELLSPLVPRRVVVQVRVSDSGGTEKVFLQCYTE